MNTYILKQLKQQGFKFLFRRYEEIGFKPIIDMPEYISDTPLKEDELISIDDAIEFANSESLKNTLIILK